MSLFKLGVALNTKTVPLKLYSLWVLLYLIFQASACPSPPTACTWETFGAEGPNPHLLLGALVGGPRVNTFSAGGPNPHLLLGALVGGPRVNTFSPGGPNPHLFTEH